MTDKNEPPVGSIPPIVATRDDVASRQPSSKAPAKKDPDRSGGGAGLAARLFIVIGFAAAAAACIWAWQLQRQLDAAGLLLTHAEQRINDLEDRLSDTDAGMNQSATAMAVKISELQAEVDKLWASAWRKNKAMIEELEKSSGEHGGQLATLGKTDSNHAAQLKALGRDIRKLKGMAGEIKRLAATARSDQELLERLGDDISRATLEVARLSKRVETGEEWQGSVDGFRRQVNQSILQLREQMAQRHPVATPN